MTSVVFSNWSSSSRTSGLSRYGNPAATPHSLSTGKYHNRIRRADMSFCQHSNTTSDSIRGRLVTIAVYTPKVKHYGNITQALTRLLFTVRHS